MRNAKLLATLACGLAVALMAACSPAAAAVLPAPATAGMQQPASDAMSVAFSFTHAAPRGGEVHHAVRTAAPAPRAGWRPRWFGYPTANADELPAPPSPAGPAMLFAHASLGAAMLDAPTDGAVAIADGGHLSPAQLRLTVPPAPAPGLPSPLPIALILALVLLPVSVVLGQALRGPPRRPVPAMRRPVAARRTEED